MGIKPNRCTQCDYSSSGSLKRHMRVHTGEKPNACTQCESNFSRHTLLATHIIKEHEKDRYVNCSQCDYSCPDADSLKRHLSIHSKEKPYKCDDCDYAAALPTTLKYHMIRHTEKKRYVQPVGTSAIRTKTWKGIL